MGAVALAMVSLPTSPADATHEPAPGRDTALACTEEAGGSGFEDIAGNTHESAIECVAFWRITTGRSAAVYAPGSITSRDQMASFIARVLDSAGVDVPWDAEQAFADVPPENPHFEAVNALAALGVVSGHGDDTYRPADPVRRDQMASYISRASAHVRGAALVDDHQWFADVANENVHAAAVNGLAGAGIVTGTDAEARRYDPHLSVRRDSMASFLARTLDVLVAEGRVAPPATGAVARVSNADGGDLGVVTFVQLGDKVEVTASIHDLPPGGFHGFHIHGNGACAPEFTEAGGHYNPGGTGHGAHAGDLPVLVVGDDGRAEARFLTDRVGVQALLAGDGTAVIIHALADNYANIPERYAPAGPDEATLATGDAGGRLGCGVVEGSYIGPRPGSAPAQAGAAVVNAEGVDIGTVTFAERDGKVEVNASVAALPAGFHGFHIHGTGACSPDFLAAGGHYNPDGTGHGGHAGDMPVLMVGDDGRAEARFLTDRVEVAALVAGDGTAVIVHALADNYANIPERYAPAGPDEATLATGDAGGRLGCGVIQTP